VGDEDKEIGLLPPKTLITPNRSSDMDYSADVKNRGENNIGGLQSVKYMMAARGTLRSSYSASCCKHGGPGRSRTADQQFRKLLLYPTELRGHALILQQGGAHWVPV
jgi:hypothetical protein